MVRRLRIAAWGVWLAVPVLTVLVVTSEWHGIPGQPRRDTYAYYQAAGAARTGGDIYHLLPPPGPHEYTGEFPFLYPPPLAAFLALLPPVSYRTFDRGWLILNLAAFWVFAASLARIANGRWRSAAVLRWGAASFFLPGFWLAWRFGNIDLVIMAMVASALASHRAGGALLVLAAAIKITPLWPLLSSATRMPGTTLRSAALGVLACVAVSVGVFGMGDSVNLAFVWFQRILPVLSQGQFWGESLDSLLAGGWHPVHYLNNLSISFLPVQLAVLNGLPYAGGTLPWGVRAWLTAVSILGPVLAAWLSRRRSPTVQAAIVFAVALFSAPIVRPYVIPVILLVIAAARGERRSGRPTATAS